MCNKDLKNDVVLVVKKTNNNCWSSTSST